ncbi:MAG: hypothetical protein WEA09_07655 [Gemmatimonadota bacterium]
MAPFGDLVEDGLVSTPARHLSALERAIQHLQALARDRRGFFDRDGAAEILSVVGELQELRRVLERGTVG